MRDQELIGEFNKNNVETIRVSINNWKAQKYIDIRIWYSEKPGEPGSEIATRKGICLNSELIDKLIGLLEEARDKVEVDND